MALKSFSPYWLKATTRFTTLGRLFKSCGLTFRTRYMQMYRGGAVLLCGAEPNLMREPGATQSQSGVISGWDDDMAAATAQ